MAVTDSRNRRVPGLSIRNGRYYGQLWIERSDGRKAARRFPLMKDLRPVATLAEAKEALEVLRHERRENALPTEGRKPSFADFADSYLTSGSFLAKKPGTQQNERQALERWKAHLGGVRIDKITPALAASFKDARLKGEKLGTTRSRKAGKRTVNMDLITLRNLLKAAEEQGHLRSLPKIALLPKPPPAPKKVLLSDQQFAALVAAARDPSLKNGEQFADYLQFLAATGAREQEALLVAWDDVDFAKRSVTIGTGGVSKNHEARTVDFNAPLAALLGEMKTRRAPDSKWLFPSPRRGPSDRPSRSFRETLKLVRTAAGLPHIAFHHLRVLFISRAVMAGIDYLTIASWVGHKDGGVLIGRVYGRLSSDHRQRMAERLS
jgi:integrase